MVGRGNGTRRGFGIGRGITIIGIMGIACTSLHQAPACLSGNPEEEMRQTIVAATCIAAFVSIGAPAHRASAATFAATPRPGIAASEDRVQKIGSACGNSACTPVLPVEYWGWGWGRPWGYRPACPYGYHYACRENPYGGRQCACWPY
jgi:hypothetical protein